MVYPTGASTERNEEIHFIKNRLLLRRNQPLVGCSNQKFNSCKYFKIGKISKSLQKWDILCNFLLIKHLFSSTKDQILLNLIKVNETSNWKVKKKNCESYEMCSWK